MFSGGGALEDWAASRAKRELTELIERAPKVAQPRRGDTVEEVPVDEVQAGDVVLVRAGEVVPVDGKLVSAEAVLDTSTLSGEPLPGLPAARRWRDPAGGDRPCRDPQRARSASGLTSSFQPERP